MLLTAVIVDHSFESSYSVQEYGDRKPQVQMLNCYKNSADVNSNKKSYLLIECFLYYLCTI